MSDELRGDGGLVSRLPAPITNPEAWPPNFADGWNACAEHALRAVQDPAADWVMVPRTPTEAMLSDFYAVANGQHPMDARHWSLTKRQLGRARSAYARMLAAAPQENSDG